MSDSAALHAKAWQFENPLQQKKAATLGMWIFLATEVLFFGGLFLGYVFYRHLYLDAFRFGSGKMELFIGTMNTALLLTSSLLVAMALHAIQHRKFQTCRLLLFGAALLGLAFLSLKGLEYYHKWQEHLVPGPNFTNEVSFATHAQLFFSFYFAMTGLHALHLAVGCALLLYYGVKVHSFCPDYNTPLELAGLYWHFVDIVWVFLYPLFYLIK